MADYPVPSLAGFDRIDDQLLTVATSSVVFSSIPSVYRRFRVYVHGISNGAADTQPALRLNSDGGSNYAHQAVDGASSTITPARTTRTSFSLTDGRAVDAVEQWLSVVEIVKPLAAQPGHMWARTAFRDTANLIRLALIAGKWANTADLISSIEILATAGQFDAASRIILTGSRSPS